MLIQKIPSLREQFIKDALKVFSSFIFLQETGILKYFDEFDLPKTAGVENTNVESVTSRTLIYLRALYQVAVPLRDVSSINDLTLTQYLLALHCSKEDEISTLATKAFGVIVRGLEHLDPALFGLWWRVVEVCIQEQDICSPNGYIQWLRCINGSVLRNSSAELQQLFDLELYWDLLIQGLLNRSYEIRKYTLHILSQSLQKINHSIDTKTMYWDVNKREQHLWEWERFGTLVNIVSIDTSIHQASDSAADLVKLIGRESLIPKTWARCLLSTGLRSPMDSIRIFVGNVALSLEKDDMAIFLDGFGFLTGTLLPQLMLASNFSVRRSSVDDDFSCVFGEQLAAFMESILRYLADNPAATNEIIEALFTHLYAERHCFDPARLYIISGIEKGLQNKRVLDSKSLSALVLLFNNFAETKMRETAFHFYYLRLLLSVGETLVTAAEWFFALTEAVSLHRSLYYEHRHYLVEYLKQYFAGFFTQSTLESLAKSADNFDTVVLFVDLASQVSSVQLDLSQLSPLFFLSVLEWPSGTELYSNASFQSKLNHFIESTIQSLVSTPQSIESIQSVLKISPSWKNLAAANWFSIKFSSNDAVDQVLTNISAIEINETNMPAISGQLVALNAALSLSSSDVSASIAKTILALATRIIRAKIANRNYLETKQTALVEVHRVLEYTLSKCAATLDTDTVVELFNVLATNFEAANYPCRMHICASFVLLLENISQTPEELASEYIYALKTLWSALAIDRLMANERTLHFDYLDLLLDPVTIALTAGRDELSEILEEILLEVVDLSYARRSLLPHTSRRLLEYLSKQDQTALPFWIGTVLTRIYTFNQAADNLFRMEIVVASKLAAHTYAKSNLYLEEYGCHEIDSKIYASMFFASLDAENDEHRKLVDSIYQYIFYNGPYHVFLPVKRNDGLEEAERVRALQVLLILSPFYTRGRGARVADEAKALFDALLPVLDNEPSPVARACAEWLLALFNVVAVRENGLEDNTILVELDKSEESPRVIASLERIGLLTARSLQRGDRALAAGFYEEYIHKLIPFSASNRAVVRHSAVSMLVALDSEVQQGDGSLEIDLQIVKVIRRICDNARASDSFKQHRSGENSIWDIDADLHLVGVCGGVIRKISDKDVGVITKKEYEECQYYVHTKLQVPAGFTISYEAWKPVLRDVQVQEVEAPELSDKTEPAPLQTKSGFWNDVINLSLGEDGRDSDKVERGELIVVASLVDKAPNLGGICRLSDVLGAKLLCLGDLAVTRSASFRSVAVTADRWMPMAEVPEAEVLAYMLRMKREQGYTLIGLEQTDKSVELNAQLRFPRKSLVLLGKEREGIPGEFLAELDFCVEIKQVGVIRSMNIQTATAVVVHAYSIQHC